MYQRILVPIDGSESSSRGLAEAIALAKLSGGRLCIFHAIDDLSVATGYESFAVYSGELLALLTARGEKLLEDAAALAAAEGVTAQTMLRETAAGRLSDLVDEQARRFSAELIVIGTHGRRGLRRLLLGSDAEQIMRTSSIPVLLVRTAPSVCQAQEVTQAIAGTAPASEPVAA